MSQIRKMGEIFFYACWPSVGVNKILWALPSRCHLPDSLRRQVIVCIEIGLSQVGVAKHVNVSRNVVKNIWE